MGAKKEKVNKKALQEAKPSKKVTALIPYSSVVIDADFLEVEAGLFAKAYKLDERLFLFDKERQTEVIDAIKAILEEMNSDIQIYSANGKRYMVFSVRAANIDDAKSRFGELREIFQHHDGDIGVYIEPVPVSEQLNLIYRFYNHFAETEMMEKVNGDEITRQTMRASRMTTKELVAPTKLNFGRDYIETSHGFVKVFFANTFANFLTPGFLNMLKLENGDFISSIHIHPVDPAPVLDAIEREIKTYKSEIINRKKKASGQKPQPAKGKQQKKIDYPDREEIHIKERYTALFREAVENGENIYQVSFTFAVFGRTLEEMNKNYEEFNSPDTKFFCKTTSLDYLQKKAMASVLPLCVQNLDIARTFNATSTAMFLPHILSTENLPYEELNKTLAHIDLYHIKTKVERVQTREKFVSKKTVQETIPYVSAHMEDGIIENVPGIFSRMYTFQDINYHTATEEDQTNFLIKYSQLLNRFDSSINCQIVINNRNVDMEQFMDENLLKMKGDNLDVYRKEYNAIVLARMEEGRNNLTKERYLVISVQEETFETAKHTFSRLDPEIVNAFKEIGGSKAEALTTVERLEILYDIYNLGHEGAFLAELKEDGKTIKATDLEAVYKMGISSKDLIAPSGFCFRRDHFIMGDKYCRVLYLAGLPNTLSDKFVSDISSNNCNMVVSMNLETIRQDKAVKMVKHQMLNINSNMQVAQQQASKSGYSMDLVPQDLKQASEEAQDLLRNLTGRNQKMFQMTFTVLLFADDMDELQTNTEILISTGRKFLCNIKTLNWQQEDGLNATLPYCFNRLSVKRTLTTDSTIIFSPFDTQELIQKRGMYYGQNATSHNLIIFNRDSSQNGNGWILGTPGSGKSFSAKREMANVFLNTDDDILIIDPEREYSPLVKAFGGSIVRIAPGSKYHLNPLDMDRDYADDDNPIVLKSDFMLSLCESVIGGRYGLSPSQIAIIDRVVNLIYTDFVDKYNYDKAYTPTLLDFEHILKAQPEREAKELALAFEIYTEGSLDVFAHESNVDINNRFVVYDIKDIGSNIKTMGYLVVLDNIWNRIVKNRKAGRKTWVYLDEVYILFEKEESTNFIRQIFSRGRKWGAKTTAITQNVEPVLQNSIATTMLSNSAFIQLLNQAPVDRDILAGLLHISPTQVGFINNAPPGQGVLYIQGQGIIPFRDNFSKQIAPNLYQVMTSKPDEMLEEFR